MLTENLENQEQQISLAESAIATHKGQSITDLPKDLYIPPNALEVFLEAFEGPLDLLLYLIKRHNMDILDIPVAEITKQYIEYIELMKILQFDLAAEYLVMAATLAEIKSRLLLPTKSTEEDDEIDPRADLIRRLQEYERYKQASEDIDELPRVERDIHIASAEPPKLISEKPKPKVELSDILSALNDVLKRAEMFEHHHIQLESLSTRERMSAILNKLKEQKFVPFMAMFTLEEGRLGVVVTFLAIMELVKESLIDIVQTEEFGPIHMQAKQGQQEATLGILDA